MNDKALIRRLRQENSLLKAKLAAYQQQSPASVVTTPAVEPESKPRQLQLVPVGRSKGWMIYVDGKPWNQRENGTTPGPFLDYLEAKKQLEVVQAILDTGRI